MKVISKQIIRKGQAVELVEHLSIDGRSLKIEIESDAYRNQCCCLLSVLDKSVPKWNVVVSRPGSGMATKEGLAYLPDRETRDFTNDFAEDRKWLLDIYTALMA